MTKELKPFFDYENIETYYNNPFDPPEGEMKILNVYFPVDTPSEDIKLYFEELLKIKKFHDIHEDTQGLIKKDLLDD